LFSITDRVAFLKNGVIHSLGTADEIKNTKDPEVRGFVTGDSL